MFNIDSNTKDNSPIRPLPGPQKVTLEKIELVKLKEDSVAPVIRVTFKTDNGGTVDRVIFEPTRENAAKRAQMARPAAMSDPEAGISKGEIPTAEQIFRQDVLNCSRDVKHILDRFISPELIDLKADSFRSLAAVMHELCVRTGAYGKSCHTELFFNKKNMLTMRQYRPFLVDENVPLDKLNLQPTKDLARTPFSETPVNNLATGPADMPALNPASADEDLPF